MTLRPLATATTLKELLDEQRAALERARVMPAANYLMAIEPIVPRAGSADPSTGRSRGAPLRWPPNSSANSKLHDMAANLADVLDDRTKRGKAPSDDEVASLERLLESVNALRPELIKKFAPPPPPPPPAAPATTVAVVVPPKAANPLQADDFNDDEPLASLPRVSSMHVASFEESVRSETLRSPLGQRTATTESVTDDGAATGDSPQTSPMLAERPPVSAGSMILSKLAKRQHKAAGESTTSAPGTSTAGSFRFMRQLKKLQAVGANPEMYRMLEQSRDAMFALFKFSAHCSEARLGSDEVIRVIEADFRQTAAASSCSIYARVLDGVGAGSWQRGVGTHFANEVLAESSIFTVPPDLDDITSMDHVCFRDADRMVVSIKADNEIIAAAELHGVAAQADLNLLENMAQIAGMFLRNNNSFLESKWQRRKAEAMLEMARRLAEENLEEERLARNIMRFTMELIEADACSLFVVSATDDGFKSVFSERSPHSNINPTFAGTIGRPFAEGVLERREVDNVLDAHADKRFDKSTDQMRGARTGSLLSVPVFFEGRLVGVQQLLREYVPDFSTQFTERDIELVRTFAAFVGVCLRNCRVNAAMLQEKRKSEAILAVVRDMNNCDIRDVHSVVSQILTGARRLLSADRATLFLVDKERHELYSKIADDTGGKVIRVRIGNGIAGTVAKTGVAANIPDAYQDPRFNKDFDLSLGYVTKSMLTEAIFFQDEVIAVAQLVNKLEASGAVGIFDESDEETFRAFALFAGISLRNSHLLNFAIDAGREAMELQEVRDGRRKGLRQESLVARNDVSEAVVSHIMCLDVSVDLRKGMMFRNFSLFDLREKEPNAADFAARLIVELMVQQGYLAEFNCPPEVFCRFVLACRDKYRTVPYHNFFHAVDVCQTVFTFIHEGRVTSSISRLDEYVLLVTSLVHDLDHMGLNNSFHLKTDSPLGMLSSASGNNSVLEVHHCNLAIEILNDPKKNVFGGLTTAQETHAYRRLIDCVLATDMQRHNDVVTDFEGIETFDVTNETHVSLACKMVLKAADISNVTKPFADSRKWGMSVTEEFYQQGDREKAAGVSVLPMFDRSLNNELAKGQIGFIDFIAAPFFRKLSDRFVGLRWTVDNIQSNRKSWVAILEGRATS